MHREPASSAVIPGYLHSSETATAKDLDLRRAAAVRDYIVSRHKLDASRMTVNAGGVGSAMVENGSAVVKVSAQ